MASTSDAESSLREIDAPFFPAQDLVRPAFCCSSVIHTSHVANIVSHRYSIQILNFMTAMKQKYSKDLIPVKDYTWKGLQNASFILELKRGTATKQERVPRRSNVERMPEQTVEGHAARRDITFGASRYFAIAEKETASFVEVLLNDGKFPWKFENVLGVCGEFVCLEKKHEKGVFQIEIWEGESALEEYYK